ncbi:MAG: hypothetical protein HQL68_08265 [Magnetococcales bacterium]|nr:hypothetical protein [Magnetococcales bacterium]
MQILLRGLDMRIAILFILVVAISLSCVVVKEAAAAEPENSLGRFFTTKKERISLDFARRKALRKKRLSALKQGKDSVQEYQQTVTLNGFVIRSKGPSAVWLNGKTALNEEETLPEGVEITPIGKVQGVSVKLKKASGRQQVLLKTGQRMDGASGIVLEPYQGIMQTLKDDAQQDGSSGKKKKQKKKKKTSKIKKKKTTANISPDEAALNDMISQREGFAKKLGFMNDLLGQ